MLDHLLCEISESTSFPFLGASLLSVACQPSLRFSRFVDKRRDGGPEFREVATLTEAHKTPPKRTLGLQCQLCWRAFPSHFLPAGQTNEEATSALDQAAAYRQATSTTSATGEMRPDRLAE